MAPLPIEAAWDCTGVALALAMPLYGSEHMLGITLGKRPFPTLLCAHTHACRLPGLAGRAVLDSPSVPQETERKAV